MLDEALRCGLSQAQELAGKEGIQMISKVKGGYQAKSSNGKNLGGPYKTSTAAKKRLRQVEFFKRQKG
jgi:hypothetical protein